MSYLEKRLPSRLVIFINGDGMHFCDTEHRILSSWGFADVRQFGGNDAEFTCRVLMDTPGKGLEDVLLHLVTKNAVSICSIIYDYIEAHMNAIED